MYKLLLPRLGQTMEEGLISQWLVGPGAPFDSGEHLYEVETEKVTTEVEANLPGTLVRVLVEPESTVAVGTLLAVVAEVGETPSGSAIDDFIASDALQFDAPTADLAVDVPVAASATPAASVPAAEGRVLAMPRTRQLAKESGIDLSQVPATGAEGLVTEADLHAVLDRAATAAPPATAARSASQPERVPLDMRIAQRERRKLTSVGRTMAQVTTRSWQQIPAFSQSLEVRATPWRRSRDRLRDETGEAIGYTDMILESAVRAVRANPDVNSSFDGDALVIWEDINISIAVDTEAGLLVPVLHHAESYDIAGRARALVELVGRARAGTLTADDVTGGTITVSNLGMFGIEGGFPMVTAPQSSIVFIGAMRDAVVAVNGAIAIAPVFSLTNAFDHRAIDGATAARFTASLKQELEGWR